MFWQDANLRTESATGTPLWLHPGHEPVYGVLHVPQDAERRDVAVLMVPPFGWDQGRSYRARRAWATALAEAGHVTLRFDLPGTEDSAGLPSDPGRLASWQQAVAGCSAWLREVSGAARVTVLGIGLGGVLAVDALANGAAIDDLILWAVPSRGRSCLRELKSYASLVASEHGSDEPTPGSEGVTGFAGYPLSDEIAGWMHSLDLTATAIPDAESHRVLMIERDRLGVDDRLRGHLAASGVDVTVIPGRDYAALAAVEVPLDSITASIEWLGEHSRPAPTRRPLNIFPAAETATFSVQGVAIREWMIELDGPEGREHGIVCAPAGAPTTDLCLVLSNPGWARRTGPNRMWVDLARRQAALGMTSVRFDLEGHGDSDGDSIRFDEIMAPYSPRFSARYDRWLDHVIDRRLGSGLVLAGLCAGASHAVMASTRLDRVRSVVAINMWAFDFTEELVEERLRVSAAASHPVSRLRRDPKITWARVRRVWTRMRQARRAHGGTPVEDAHARTATALLERLANADVDALFLYSQGEVTYDEVQRRGLDDPQRRPGVSFEQLLTTDHNIRQQKIQALVNARMDAAIAAARAKTSRTHHLV